MRSSTRMQAAVAAAWASDVGAHGLHWQRARTMGELFLESEPEWRFYEELKARNMRFELRVQRPRLRSEDDLQGRGEFRVSTT